MKKVDQNDLRSLRFFSILATVVFLSAGLTLLLELTREGLALTDLENQIYIPVAHSSPRRAPIPKLVASIPLEEARCPTDISYNRKSGDLYITNEESDNVTVIRDQVVVDNLNTGKVPNRVESDPESDRAYVTHLFSDISILNSGAITDSIPRYSEPFSITINPINDYVYINDLHGPITIIRGTDRIMDLWVPDFNGFDIYWQLAADYDYLTGLTYFASWQYGVISVVDGLEVIDQFNFHGEGAHDMIVDSQRRLIVVANVRAREGGQQRNNISVVDLDTKDVTKIYSGKISKYVALDSYTGYVYVTNPENDTVTVLNGKQEIGTYWVGDNPHGVTVDQVTGYAYIAVRGDHSVYVFKNGVPVANIELPDNKGFQSSLVTIDEENGLVYVLDRSSIKHDSHRGKMVVECKKPWVHVLQY